jgi:hypothetical protein
MRSLECGIVLLATSAVGCFSFAPSDGVVTCGTSGCPVGYVCRTDLTCGHDELPVDAPFEFDASNLDGSTWVLGMGPMNLAGDVILDTTARTARTGGGVTIPLPDVAVISVAQGPNFPSLTVWVASSIRIAEGAKVRVTGRSALVLVSVGEIEIAGMLDAAADSMLLSPGPGGGAGGQAVGQVGEGVGGGPVCPTAVGMPQPCGGAGGSFGTLGGPGGPYAGTAAPVGTIYGSARQVPLIAGSGGGAAGKLPGAGGGGGGAVQVSSRTTITVTPTGVIHVGGAGGFQGQGNAGGGGGGGSGGAILLEAPTISIKGTLAGNGGGGGAGENGDVFAITERGATATPDLINARGGESISGGMNGGRGSILAENGGPGVLGVSGSGGGGGGVGRISLRSIAPAMTDGATITPGAALVGVP